eukprot:jgi/Mesvir1/29291/Mv01556-RA.1
MGNIQQKSRPAKSSQPQDPLSVPQVFLPDTLPVLRTEYGTLYGKAGGAAELATAAHVTPHAVLIATPHARHIATPHVPEGTPHASTRSSPQGGPTPSKSASPSPHNKSASQSPSPSPSPSRSALPATRKSHYGTAVGAAPVFRVLPDATAGGGDGTKQYFVVKPKNQASDGRIYFVKKKGVAIAHTVAAPPTHQSPAANGTHRAADGSSPGITSAAAREDPTCVIGPQPDGVALSSHKQSCLGERSNAGEHPSSPEQPSPHEQLNSHRQHSAREQPSSHDQPGSCERDYERDDSRLNEPPPAGPRPDGQGPTTVATPPPQPNPRHPLPKLPSMGPSPSGQAPPAVVTPDPSVATPIPDRWHPLPDLILNRRFLVTPDIASPVGNDVSQSGVVLAVGDQGVQVTPRERVATEAGLASSPTGVGRPAAIETGTESSHPAVVRVVLEAGESGHTGEGSGASGSEVDPESSHLLGGQSRGPAEAGAQFPSDLEGGGPGGGAGGGGASNRHERPPLGH